MAEFNSNQAAEQAADQINISTDKLEKQIRKIEILGIKTLFSTMKFD